MQSTSVNKKFRCGTSNIVVPIKRNDFNLAHAQSSRLHYYSTVFNTVELNSTFYKIPMHRTFEKWRDDVGEDFRFTLKLLQEVTHSKELKQGLEQVDVFLEAADRLGIKKGCLLVQFPGKITFSYFNELQAILAQLRDADNEWQVAVELRHASWYAAETYELLNEHQCNLVLHDKPLAPRPRRGEENSSITLNGFTILPAPDQMENSALQRLFKNASFMYYRFHGPAGDYRGSYSDQHLIDVAGSIKKDLKTGKTVYAYFNNTMGDAYNNATLLKSLIDQ